MNKSLSIILSTTILLSCSGPPGIKDRPEKGKWEKCPLCKGTGTAKLKKQQHDPGTGGSEELNEPARVGCFLFSLFYVTDSLAKGREPDLDEDRQNLLNAKAEHLEEGRNSNVRSRPAEVKVKCPRCNGLGWEKPQEDEPWKQSHLSSEEKENIEKLNKSINSREQ